MGLLWKGHSSIIPLTAFPLEHFDIASLSVSTADHVRGWYKCIHQIEGLDRREVQKEKVKPENLEYDCD